jgi:hypothetical protein
MPNPFVQSNFPRIPNDFYPTVDERCVYGFLGWFQPRGLVVDPCAPNGSGIVNTLRECGYQALGLPDAFGEFPPGAAWIVCNPPYARPLVDEIILDGIRRVMSGEVVGAADLLRSTFDHAASRAHLFEHAYYDGQIKLRFRPWWSDDHSKQPIHNFVWHVWSRPNFYGDEYPAVLYSNGGKPNV